MSSDPPSTPSPSLPSDRLPVDRRRSWPVVAVFVCIIGVQVAVAAMSMELLSAVRAYVTGESLYSKGQKDAQIYVRDYVEAYREQDYQRFLQALAVPLGDRRAREELQKSRPDLAVVRQGFLDGGNHPDDVTGLIRLFGWFGRLPFMADALSIWAEGDAVIEEMVGLVTRAHERIAVGDFEADAVREMREQAPGLNARLTELTSRFSAQLGETSRQTLSLLHAVNLAMAVLLAATGLAFVRHSARIQAATEGEVRRRQESLQRLLDSAAEGLYGVDLLGRCTFVNRAALRMLGYASESELLQHDIHALIHHSTPDGRRYAPGESALQRRSVEQREMHVTDEVFWRRDGSAFSVEYWSHPVRRDGRVDGAVVTFLDISERLRMEAALREGDLRMTRLVDTVNDGVVTIEAGERVVLFNRAAERLFGVSAADAIGSPIGRFIPGWAGSGPPTAIGPVGGPASGRPPVTLFELTGSRAGGEPFPLEASLSRLPTEGGELQTVVLRDVTELHAARAERQAREALEATDRAKTEFLSRMSHELRTPLNAVLGFSQLLRLDRAEPPSARQLERIGHIETAGGHLLALVNDVLDLSRVESGQMPLLLEAVDLRSVAEDALAMVMPLAAAGGVTLEIAEMAASADGAEAVRAAAATDGATDGAADAPAEVGAPDASPTAVAPTTQAAPTPPADPPVVADRVRLRQVFVNLLSNAVKYNRPGGSVVMAWRMEGGACRIDITDTGRGMSADKLARLFEPFNRLGAEKSQIEGTGIGLVLSRGLVALMSGRLEVHSRVGVGTVATVVLEQSTEPAASRAVHLPPSQHGHLDGSLNVLYAEDNEVNVELVRQIVTLRPAIRLRVAENGRTALRMARQEPPDLMLVDMHLGDMTGLDLARALRQKSSTADVQLVALSADALPEQIDTALAAGFVSYLTKPVDFRKLLDILDRRLGG